MLGKFVQLCSNLFIFCIYIHFNVLINKYISIFIFTVQILKNTAYICMIYCTTCICDCTKFTAQLHNTAQLIFALCSCKLFFFNHLQRLLHNCTNFPTFFSLWKNTFIVCKNCRKKRCFSSGKVLEKGYIYVLVIYR